MTEQEMMALCCGRVFVYKTGRPEITIYMGKNNAILMIRLNADHTVSFPTHIDFYPDERYWYWDNDEQCILFTDKEDKNVVSKYSAPIVEGDKYISLKCLTKKNVRYLTYLSFDMENWIQKAPRLNTQFLLLAGNSLLNDEKKQLDAVVTAKQAQTVWLEDSGGCWDLIDSAWNKLARDSGVRAVYLMFSGLPAATDDLFPSKLQIQAANPAKSFIAGPRRDVLLILTQLLVRHNQQIMAREECLSWTELTKDIVKE